MPDPDTDKFAPINDVDAVLREAKERFEASRDYESQWRMHAHEDLIFFEGDARNHAQWDDAVYVGRSAGYGGSPRPCLTINKTDTHTRHVENGARQSQMGIKINATGYGADAKCAEVLEGIIRHIEAESNAQQNAYATAIQGQVRQGCGWVHLITDYVRGQDTFDQDFYIKSVPDPTAVYFDPNAIEPDKSDGRYGMIVEEIPRQQFLRDFPEYHDLTGTEPLQGVAGEGARTREDKNAVRILYYYRRNEEKDTLYAIPRGGRIESVRASMMAPELLAWCRANKCHSRPVTRPHVEFFLIAGDTIISRGVTVFSHIPLVPFIGRESVIKGRMDRKGLVRSLIDPQRMYNYSASAFVESIALQTKSPWLADDRAIEGYQDIWAQANTGNQAYLPYHASDPEDSSPIPPPTRLEPPSGSTGHLQAMQNAEAQMSMVTGQFDAELGADGNEKSGVAIGNRQRQSETSNYDFTDNQAMGLRLLGKIILEAIPYIYDTERAVQVLGMDGSRREASIRPGQDGAVQALDRETGQPLTPRQLAEAQRDKKMMEGIHLAINPSIGRYTVEADVGPAFATRRQEAFQSLCQVIGMAPQLASVVLPFLFDSADFPFADDIRDALEKAPDPQMQQAQAQIQQLQAQLQQAQAQLQNRQADYQLRASKQENEAAVAQARIAVDGQRAETDRLAAIGSIDPASLMPVLTDLVRQILAENAGQDPATGPAQVTPAPDAPQPGTLQTVPRMESTNPPGGPVRAAIPTEGAVSP